MVASKLSKITQAAYFAAIASALLGIVRDYTILKISPSSKEFYDLLYIGGLCSIFAVNSIILDLRPPTVRLFAYLLIFSIGLLILAWLWKPNYFNGSFVNFSVICFVVIMWICGAVASRAQMSAGFAFTARFRDALFSLAMTLLLSFGISVILAFLVGVLISTVWVIWITQPRWENFFLDKSAKDKWPHLLRTIALLNIGTVTMLLWALHFNDSDIFLWGYSLTAIIRISMYIFQSLSIGLSVISTHMPVLHPKLRRCSLSFAMGLLGCGLFVSWISLGTALIVMPIAVACSQYFIIIYLHQKNILKNTL